MDCNKMLLLPLDLHKIQIESVGYFDSLCGKKYSFAFRLYASIDLAATFLARLERLILDEFHHRNIVHFRFWVDLFQQYSMYSLIFSNIGIIGAAGV